MNTRQMIVIFCLFAVFFSALSIASASDVVDNMTVSVANDENIVDMANCNEVVLGDSPGTFAELDGEIQSVSANENISLDKDYTYSDSTDQPISISNSMTIDGHGYTLDAQSKISIFNIKDNSHVILKNIVFKNGYGINGSAVNVDLGSSVEILNCTFINNTATNYGGAIYNVADSSTVTSKITNSRFEENNAHNGGGIYIHSNKAIIDNTTFTGNYAVNDGAAIFIDGDGCTLENSTFTDNIAGDDGAAVYWQGSNGLIYNITCSRNLGVSGFDPIDGTYSSSKGGTICLTGSNVTIRKSNFKDTYATYDGGALFITGNNDKVVDCTFDDCTSIATDGGVLYVIGNYTEVLNCDFEGCNANLSGGVIYVVGHDVDISHATFTANGANLDGAALYIAGDNCSLSNSTFKDNIAGDDGGAIFWEGNNGYMYNITCSNNKGISDNKGADPDPSNSKGGTICLTGSNITIDKSKFTQSSAVVDGGALFITGNDVNVFNSVFKECISTSSGGGAIYIIGNRTSVKNCTFDDCNVDNLDAAKHRGGAIHVEGNNAHISDSSFTNTKALIGGAICIEGDYTVVDNSKFTHNDASGPPGGSGGAIYVEGTGAVISNSEFLYGTTVNYGGAISIWGPNAIIVNNTFNQSKTTTYNGGAIFVNGKNTTIEFSNFTQCDALGDSFARGGAIDVQGDDANIIGCNFDDCNSHYGGVIYVSGTNAAIRDSDFKNSEANRGGAIYVEGINTTIFKSDFTDISANDYGGSIYVAGANANISESNFIRSIVKNHNGGAIFIAGENTNIEKSNFTSAQALHTRNKPLGGAIYVEGLHAVIKESNFNDCKATEGGGAIYSLGNSATIEDSTFNSSTAKYGGAIYLTSWGSSVTRSNVSDCIAGENGGGIYVDEGSIQISESNFNVCIAKGTSANNGGGAIYINGPDTHISNSNFSTNKAPNNSARGGSIFIKGERTIIDGSVFEWGSASQGGEIFIEGANAIIDLSEFVNSSSKSSGGSIYVKGDEATIKQSIFENISAKSNGGAIFVDGEQTDILDSSFVNCTVGSGYKGGAIYIDDIGTTVAYSNFTQSYAGTGGAIYINGKNTTISYCNLHNNTASTAGAIKVFGDDTIISNSNFTYNSALFSSGGALDIGGSNASVYYSWFDHNDALTDGGAINWLGGHGDDSIIGSTFSNNVQHGNSKGGGAIYWTQGSVIAAGGLIKDSIFINNTAAGRHGGAINWFHSLDSKIDNCLFVNNTANCDGGALYTGDQGGKSKNLTITNSQFYNNTAMLYGGAITNQMTNSLIFNNIFDGNTAYAGGGTIVMKEGPARNSVVDHCYIYNSSVGDVRGGYGEGGGAIYIADSNITISNSAIEGSTILHGQGGAIKVIASDGSLINVTIQDVNTQNDEGGAVYWNGVNGYMNNITIFNSSSNSINGDRSSNGGAIHVSGWYCTLNDIKIYKSSANNDENCTKTNYGGAIYVGGTGDVLTNIIIDDSSSTNAKMSAAGGAIYYNGYKGTLINATISNTFATGIGGAICWKGGSPLEINNISITYSQTSVTNSSNIADGGAIYTTTVGELNNIYINGASANKDSGDVHGGAIYMKDGKTLNNVTVIGSRATTDDGTSYGGAVYFERGYGSTNVWVYNSSFEENNADLGGGLYIKSITGRIYNTSFTGNVANNDGGGLYGVGGDDLMYNVSFEHNSAKRGGAIFTNNVQIQMEDSALEFNTAEEKGGAIYHDYSNKGGSSLIKNTDIVNNTAFQGSAMYATKLNKLALNSVVLLDNQANSNKFVEKAVGVDESGNNYTSAVFVGYDNLLNAIWQESNYALSCNNVTYWGVDGKIVANVPPTQSDREVNINVTVEMYDENGKQLTTVPLVTDANGKVKYVFDAEDGKTYYFAYVHEADRYYTYLRDTLSNRSLVKVYTDTPLYYSQNQTVLIELTDGAWGNLNGTVNVVFNDTAHTTFTIDVVNGVGIKSNISGLPIGKYNVTASFKGDLNHTGDTDWTVFEVIPYDDLEITKDVNVTADYVNITDVIKYTITVTNHGPSRAYGVNVTERLSPYLKLTKSKATKGNYNLTAGYWYIGELDVDDFETLTIIAEVVHMGPITNTVWVTGVGKDINETNNVATAHNFTAVPIIDLRITKDVNVTKDVIGVLDVIRFNVTVFNDGPCNATGVIVEELIDSHLNVISSTTTTGSYGAGTWNIGNLAKGANATLIIVAQVVYSGNISNVVHVYGFENETDYTNNVASIKNITAIANADLKITKKVNVSGIVNVTDKIKFTVSVVNNGPCNATGVYASETLSPHLRLVSNETTIGKWDGSTWVIGNLNSGEVHNLTIVAEVISSGIISNAVSVLGNDNDTNRSNNNDSIKNITAVDIVDLEITKTVNVASTVVNVTDKIIFTITVRNNGPCDATDVSVSEVLSPHLRMYHHETFASRYDVDEGVWYIGNLAKNDWRQLVIYAEVISAGNISNVVVVTSTENDTNKSNNNASIPNITARDIVDLQIKKEVNTTVNVINVTDIIKYTITVFNAGPCNATGVNVSEVLSPHLKLIKNETENGYYDAGEGIWYIGILNNQSTAVLNITAQVISNGIISNVVIANSTEKDSDLSNNRAEIADITAVNIVDLQITKEVNVSSTEIDMSDVLKFTITVHNNGPCNATGVIVAEPLSDMLNVISNVTTAGKWDGYTWNIGDLANGADATLTIIASIAYAGIVENEVNVTGIEIDTDISNNNDSITPLHVSAHADFGVNKTVNVTDGVVNVGDLVKFTITAYNKGPCNASGVYVAEILDSHLGEYTYVASKGTFAESTWNIGNLGDNENVTLTIVARVIAPGNFSNYVQIFGYGNDTNESNNNASIPNITAVPVVDLEIAKEVNVNTDTVNFGDEIIFTINVRNNGPCDATGVNVTEILSSHLKMDHYDAFGSNYDPSVSYYDVSEGIWYIGDLDCNGWCKLVIYAEVISAGNISNAVNVTSAENDTNKSNNNASIPNITAIPIVDLQINKEINVTSDVIYVLDEIKFTITVYNAGPCNATGVNVSEVLSPHLKLIKNETENGYYDVADGIWYIGNLTNKSAAAVLTITAQVISDGVISNVVVVNSTEKDTNLSNNKAEISNKTAVLLFDLQINKTVNVTDINVGVTDEIEFKITVYNAGPCNATDVYVYESLSDKLDLIRNVTSVGNWDGRIWYIGDLNNGSRATLTIVARIAYSGIIENVVNVTGNGTDTNMSNNKDDITPLNATIHVDLTIEKTVNVTTGVVNVTDLVKFTIVAHNNCTYNANGVYVIEELDSHLGEYTYNATEGTTYDGHKWVIGKLNAGEYAKLVIVARVIKAGNFSNHVEIVGDDLDTNESNNNATVPNITAVPIVDLNITKEVNVTNGTVFYGDTVMFTITVSNNGPCDASNVNVSEVLSPILEIKEYQAYGIHYDSSVSYYNATEGVWYIGNLANGDWCKLVIIANVVDVGNFTNEVNVTSTEIDTNESNNNASIPNITAKPVVDLRIIKTVNVTSEVVNVTDVIKFTLTIFNDGPCNATNVYVLEPLSYKLQLINWTATKYANFGYDGYTCVVGNMSVGENATFTITAKIVYSGIIENDVYVTSNDDDFNQENNYDGITPLTAITTVDLGINKTVNVTAGAVNVSDWVEFNITAYNKGPNNASGVYVLEALDSCLGEYTYVASEGTTYDGYTWYIGYLNAGQNATLRIVARVAEPGNFSNYVEIFGYDPDCNTSNNNATVDNITAIPIVDLEISKQVNVDSSITYVGDTVVFTVTVRNNGPSDASNVNVSEVLSPHLRLVDAITWDGYYDVNDGVWYIGDLARYDWRQLILVTEVISVGNISNAVAVTSQENDTNISNNNASIPNITAKPAVDLQITKEVNVTSGFVSVFDFIEYTITVYNDGPCDASGVNVSEVLNPSLDLIRNETESGYYNVTEGIWYIGDLANGSTVKLTIVAQIVRNGTVISNVVIADSAEKDINPFNNMDETVTYVLPVVDLRITKEVNVTSEVGVTDLIKFTVTVYNDGPCEATGIYVTESLSDKLHLISNKTTVGKWDGYTWNIPELGIGANASLTIIAQVIYAGNISNDVVIHGYQNETNYTNNNASIPNITAVTNADLLITKEANVSAVNVYDLIRFTITVKNNGPCDASGVIVSEILDSHLMHVSNTTTLGRYDGFTWNIGNLTNQSTAVLTIIARVVSPGKISNAVKVSGSDNDTNTSNNEANITNITTLQGVDLIVEKTVNVTVVNVGGLIKYTITVVNDGPSNATGVEVSDKLDSHLKFVSFNSSHPGITYDNITGTSKIGNLNAGESVVLEIVAKAISKGTIENTAIATANEKDTNKSNNNGSCDNVTALPMVDIKVTKSVNATVVNVSDLVKYTIAVVNYGPSGASGVEISDKLDSHLKFVSFGSTRPGITYDNITGTFKIGNLGIGERIVLEIVAQVISNGTIENTASATSIENDTNVSNNNGSCDNVTALPVVDVKVTKTVNVTEAKIGDTLSYIINVVNNGPSEATDVNVFEKLSDYVTLIKYNASKGNYDFNNNNWYVGKLTKCETATLKLTVKVISNGTIENVVSVSSAENDTNLTNNNYTCENVTAEGVLTPISLDAYDITYGDDEILTVTLPDGATGTVNITVGNRTYVGVPIEDGKAILPVIDLAGGNYAVDVIYGGNGKYPSNSTTGTFNVARVVPIITIEVEDIWVGEIEVLNVTVNAPGVVYVTVYGKTVEIPLENGVAITDVLAVTKHDYKGYATWNLINLPVGAYPAYALYPGNENYTSVDTSDLFHVRVIPTTIIVTAKDIKVGENAVINIKMEPDDISGPVKVVVDGKTYDIYVTNGEGRLIVPDLSTGNKKVYVKYDAINPYRSSENKTVFNVAKLKPPVEINSPLINVGEDAEIDVYVPDDATGTITIEIDGKRYTEPIEDGMAVFIIPDLKVGVYDIVAYYSGDDKYLPGDSIGDISVNPLKDDDNNTTTVNVNKHSVGGGIDLSQYATGNPIFVMLILVLTLGSVSLRRFK